MKSTITLLAVTLVLAGCGSSGNPGTAELLAGAHASLARGDNDMARQWLITAQGEVETARERKELALLTAELDLRSGRADRALASMEPLLVEHPADPRVHELAGKSRLMLGDFAPAGRHFTLAMEGYRRQQDADRAADLLALARGFQSYALGKVALAEEQWETIRSDELRASVYGSTSTGGSARSNDGRELFFARNNAR